MSEESDAILKRLGEVQRRLEEVKQQLDREHDAGGCNQCRFVVFGLFQDLLENVSNINKRVDTLESAFIRTHDGLDVEGHRLYHTSVVGSRRSWMATLNQLRDWAIKGVLGAMAIGICTLILDWIRRGP